MNFRSVFLLISLLSACNLWSSKAQATDQSKNSALLGQNKAGKDVAITDVRMEMVNASAHIAAIYFTLQNTGENTYLVTNVSSTICPKLVGHHSDQESTPGTLNLFTHLSVPAHTNLVFPPGGYHLLCLDMAPEGEGQQDVPVTFTFLGGAQKTVKAHSQKLSGANPT